MKKILLGFFLFCVFYVQGFEDEEKIFGLRPEPEYYDITEKDLKFQLYTRKNKDNGVTLVIGDKEGLKVSGFKGSLPIKLGTHGFLDSGNSKWLHRLKEELLKTEEMNVIILDWSACAKNILYPQVVKCMKKTAMYTGNLLQFLQKAGNADLSKIHLIGHSLGAHLASFAAEAFPKKTIGRITGLDPAGPLFENNEEGDRINPYRAKVVDIIHTCRIFTGMKKPVGTIDFYPNGGYNQPGCFVLDQNCHHRYAHKYFIDSIAKSRENKYAAVQCETLDQAFDGLCSGSPGLMGYYSDKSKPGIYYLRTESVPAHGALFPPYLFPKDN